MIATHHLTKGEVTILQALDQTEGKVLDFQSLLKALETTPRGARTIINQMLDQRLIDHSEAPETYRDLTLTFKGMQALKGING